MPVRIIEQGPRNCIVHINGTGAETGLAFDPVNLAPGFTRVNINKIWYSLPSGASVALDWVATANLRAFTVNPNGDFLDFQFFGGITNNAGAGRTGGLNYTGGGTGDWSIILHLVKH